MTFSTQPSRAVPYVIVLSFLLMCSSFAVAHGNDSREVRLPASEQQEILDLISAYSYSYDSKDPVRWVSLFTDDAIWQWYAGPSKTLFRDVQGKAALRTFVEGLVANLRSQGIQSRHYQTNTVFTSVNKGTVKITTMILITWQYATDTAPKTIHSGVYEDEFVKTRDGWKFKKRVLYNDHN